jgi:hypothetical protein
VGLELTLRRQALVRLLFPDFSGVSLHHLPRLVSIADHSLCCKLTPLAWIRKEAANLSTALLPHEHRWPCELPGGLVPFGQPLRRFGFATGEDFRCNHISIYEIGV